MLWILLAPPAAYIFGAALNQSVIIANHGKFPVMMNPTAAADAQPDANGMLDGVHCLMTNDTRFNALADIINRGDGICSIGDLFITLGEWMWAFCPFVWGALVAQRLLAC
jgi:hypothetical protein